MDKICDSDKCTGCGACSGICPKDCIQLLPDNAESGHIHPVIDNNLCINCGLCVSTCPVNNPVARNHPAGTFAAYNLDDRVCNNSSSGGLAYTLGNLIISQGGVVYGSVVEEGSKFCIRHERCINTEDLSRTQGSKYVQSKIPREIYRQVKKDLTEGRMVLFVGTGCQVAGIRNYLKKDYPNFYAIDIICHGVPSFALLRDYLSIRYDTTKIKNLKFRSNNSFNISATYGHDETPVSLPLDSNLYMMGFLKGLYYRESCYSCTFADIKRCGDITLGDFWGLKKSISPHHRQSTGTSVVLVNNAKGEELLSRIAAELKIEERPTAEAVNGNPQLRSPSKKHFAAYIFKNLYPRIGFKWAARISLGREKLFYACFLPMLQKIQSLRRQ